MAVYRRSYKPYDGGLTNGWSRFLIVVKYALDDLRRSRLLLTFRLLCFVPILIELAMIYLLHSTSARALLGMTGDSMKNPLAIDANFFYVCFSIQQTLAFFLAAWIGPGLVSPDLSNNALALYLCRPFSRTEYVLGKSTVLGYTLSSITWVPLLVLFILQANLEGNGWGRTNLRIASAIFLGSVIWIGLISMLSLALSAWIRWRLAATGLMFAVFFVLAGFGTIFNAVLRTYWGKLTNLSYLMGIVVRSLFNLPIVQAGKRFRVRPWEDVDVPLSVAWGVLVAVCLGCLWLLNARLRAKEVS